MCTTDPRDAPTDNWVLVRALWEQRFTLSERAKPYSADGPACVFEPNDAVVRIEREVLGAPAAWPAGASTSR